MDARLGPAKAKQMKFYRHAIAAAVVVLGAATLSHAMIPRELAKYASESFNLQTIVPSEFGDWKQVPGSSLVVPTDTDSLERQLYSKELGRSYVDRDGHVVMLLIAYGPNQGGRLQAHRPELCYVGSGFNISATVDTELSLASDAPSLKLNRLTAQRGPRFEPISYWLRVGDDVVNSAMDRQIARFKYSLRGMIADGAIIRVSTAGLPETAAFEVQDRFIRDLLGAIDPKDRAFFVGTELATHTKPLTAS
jgi:EpsI family protein